ncbi:MOSC domain-containing protein [Aquimarina sp. D1M17]|uniref:MOSC domain-containing protein n=1 Tax=Aquimarina acroporae TaxID=2937283 RepID=UPI0020BDD47F|nr:MOSC domain-containing protein [Aquimarina acroporae]MCK8520540.1 MOSC domain-containing protein [Aquimarina acroporae]
MRVVSTNIGEPVTISWRGKEVKTGIYKYPVEKPIFLGKEDVENDHVVDRRVHGGVDKACYLYGVENYSYWKEKYPQLDWDFGMFGENLTIEGFSENQVKIGSIYKLGTALVQISRPRQPCYKLGVRFENPTIIKQFIDSKLSGVYVRVLEPGLVSTNDTMILEKEHVNGITITELNTLLFHFDEKLHTDLLEKAIQDTLVSDDDKKYFAKKK